MRRLGAILTAAAIAVPVAGMSTPAAQAADEIKSVAGWASTLRFVHGWFDFKDMVNEKGKGTVEIIYLGGPEVVPPTQQGQAVRSGFVDLAYVPPAYYAGLLPEAEALVGRRKLGSELRNNGGLEMLRDIWAKKMNVYMLGNFDTTTQYHLYLTKEPKITDGRPDFSGMKIRVTPTYRSLVREFGGTGVSISSAETFNAFERGLVEGLGWPQIDFMALKIGKFVKYKVEPPILSMTISPLINLDKWKSLSPKTREFLEQAATEWEVTSEKRASELVKTEAREMAEIGVKTYTMPPEAAKVYVERAWAGAWEGFEKKMPDEARKLKEKLL